ncbi:FAD-dependent monooxygenase, partial [Sphingomonas sp.]|uniref:FAD-dependent monooxygenase n=1 Tax=Sphingomonas sp. TaxID=28214 RepID=UPI0025D52CFE
MHNLAWKLAAVASGSSSPALLDSYDAERRPVAWRRHQQIFARPDYAKEAQGWAEDEPIIDDDAMEFGQIYRSTAIIGAGPELPAAKRPDEWRGQPGTRAPHFPIGEGSAPRSFLDLLQRGWLLVATDPTWRTIAREAAAIARQAVV